MLNSGEKKFARRATKQINILTLVLAEKKFLKGKKNHNPAPCKLNGGSLSVSSSQQVLGLTMKCCWLSGQV